jgi:hypothetical protein
VRCGIIATSGNYGYRRMTAAEESYLAKFRALHLKQAEIEAAASDLRSICESLKDWRKTASTLGSPGVHPQQSRGAYPPLPLAFEEMRSWLARKKGRDCRVVQRSEEADGELLKALVPLPARLLETPSKR